MKNKKTVVETKVSKTQRNKIKKKCEKITLDSVNIWANSLALELSLLKNSGVSEQVCAEILDEVSASCTDLNSAFVKRLGKEIIGTFARYGF